MTKKWYEEIEQDIPTPVSNASPTNELKKWYQELEEAPAEQPKAASDNQFTPSIGGFVPKEEEKWSNPKYIAAQVLGGAGSRNIPFIRDLVPMTQTERDATNYLEQNNPALKKAGDIGSSIVGGLPAAAIGSSGGLPAYMAMQALAQPAIGAADRVLHDPNISKEEQYNKAKMEALLGAAGPVVSKALAPNANPVLSDPKFYKEALEKQAAPYVNKYVGAPSGWKNWLPLTAADDLAKYITKKWWGNQASPAVINSMTNEAGHDTYNFITGDHNKRKLEMLRGE